LTDEEIKKRRAALSKAARKPVLALSGAAGKGVKEVLSALLKHIRKDRPAPSREKAPRREKRRQAKPAPEPWHPLNRRGEA
jgi:hypothetical protein